MILFQRKPFGVPVLLFLLVGLGIGAGPVQAIAAGLTGRAGGLDSRAATGTPETRQRD